MQFKSFYNDWVDCSGMIAENGKNHTINLSVDFFKDLKFDADTLKKYRIDAATRCAETLGENPALCLSGGVDSQAMIQCWVEAKLKFDVVIGVFNDGLNEHDVNHAMQFCKKFDVPYKELNINITELLARDNFAISERYKSISPHFNTHYKIVELLSDLGYTGSCFGGVAPFLRNGNWGQNFSGAPFHFVKIQNELPIPMQGSFLSFSPELAWAIGLQTPETNHMNNRYLLPTEQGTIDFVNAVRYAEKLEGYTNSGFKLIPQETKFTGFEYVKKYYEKKYKDGWAFEKQFRFPIAKMYGKDPHEYLFSLTDDLASALASIHRECLTSSQYPSTRVRV